MKTFDWQDKYYNASGIDITTSAKYHSLLGTKTGTGKRDNPIFAQNVRDTASTYHIFGSGVFDFSILADSGTESQVIGQGINQTRFDKLTALNGMYNGSLSLYNASLSLKADSKARGSIINCYVSDFNNLSYNLSFNSSIIKNFTNISEGRFSACTFVENAINSVFPNTGLFSKCTVIINQTNIDNYRNNYLAFNNCKFQIGGETSATPLMGVTADDLRKNFADRCKTQNITVPTFTEYGETNVPMGRWVFSNTSVSGEYDTIENSEIDSFAKQRSLYFGHTEKTVKVIPIVSTDNEPQSFAPNNPKSKTTVSDNSITLDKTTSIIDRHLGYADSKIIWLGGKYELTALNIIHNLPADVGVAVDSLFSFGDPVTSGEIEPEINYMVRSSDKLSATIKYNGVEYTTSLTDRNNVFRGIANMKTFEIVSGKPLVLPVLDFANFNTVQMRIVTYLPTEKITAGNLQAGYWYFVAPDNLADTTGSIIYKGVKRACFDSFLATDIDAVSGAEKCHLRRCWRQDYNEANEVTDKAFWSGKQKPKLFDVLPTDLRCFHKNNSPSEPEMQSDANGDYMASGHIDFYNGVNGLAGFKIPAFPIVGSFMQIRIPISTLNPM